MTLCIAFRACVEWTTHLWAGRVGRHGGLQVPHLVYGGNSPPEGAPATMAVQPQDPESWHVQVPLPLSATCDLQ